MLNPDFRDMLSALSAEGVAYLVVGAYAMAAHGRPRATGDLDVWIRPTADYAARTMRALRRFGAPLHDLAESDLTTPGTVFQIGVAPNRIDLMNEIEGVEFEDAWRARQTHVVDGLGLPVLGRDHLLGYKRATGRARDLADAAWLESEDPGD